MHAACATQIIQFAQQLKFESRYVITVLEKTPLFCSGVNKCIRNEDKQNERKIKMNEK